MGTPSILPILAAALLGQHVVVVPLDALAPPPEVPEEPPVEALVDSVAVVIDPADETRVEMRWELRAITPGWVDVPVTGAMLALDEATLDGLPVAVDPGPDGVRRLTVFLDGRHQLEVSGTVATPESSLALPLLFAARATVTVAGGPWDVEIEDAVVRSGQQFDLVETDQLALSWRPAAPPAPRPIVISSEGAVAFRVDGGGAEANAVVRAKIRHGAVESLRVGLSGAVEDLVVEGAGVRDHRRVGDEVEVGFSRPVEGSVTLELSYRVPPPEDDGLARLPVPWSRDTRELWVTVLRGDESMVVPEPERGLEPVIAAELPEWATGLAPGEQVASYRAAGGTPELQVRVLHYEPVEEPPTLVDEARYEIAYTSHGRVLLRARYQVRNDRNQYLHVMPPDGYEPIGARVAGIVAQPAADGAGGLYVPLEKSVETLEGLVSFPVEVLFWGQEPAWERRGTRTLVSPSVDAPIAYARWEVVLPPDREAKAAVSDATLVERWTDRDKGLTYGRAHGEVLHDEDTDRTEAKDGKKKTKAIQVVQRRSSRGPPAPPPPPALRAKRPAGRATAAGGGGQGARRAKPAADPNKAVIVAGAISSEESKEMQEDLSVEVFNRAYSAYKTNKFEEAGDLLDKSLELDPYNRAAEALQSNVDVFIGGEESGGKGEEEVMSRRVRELAQAKTQGQRVAQEKLKEEAERSFRAGDMEKAQKDFARLVEVTEELAVVEQAETWEQKSQLESYQRQLEDIEQQIEETRQKVVVSKQSLQLLEDSVLEGRDFRSVVVDAGEGGRNREEEYRWGDDGVVGGVEGGVVGGVGGGVLGGIADPTDEPVQVSGTTTTITHYNFEDISIDGELLKPAGTFVVTPGFREGALVRTDGANIADRSPTTGTESSADGSWRELAEMEQRLGYDQHAGGNYYAPTDVSGIDEPPPVPEPEAQTMFHGIPDRYMRINVPAEDIDGYEDEDGLPDLDMDYDAVVDMADTQDEPIFEYATSPAESIVVDRPRTSHMDSLLDVRVDFDDIELLPGKVAIIFNEKNIEGEFEEDWKPPTVPLIKIKSEPRGGRIGPAQTDVDSRHRDRADNRSPDDASGRWSGEQLAETRGEKARDLGGDEGQRAASVVQVTASALSIRVPRAGESLRFEQRLIPENTPMTAELRYRPIRGSSDGRNR